MRLLDWHDGQFEFSPCAIGGRDELSIDRDAAPARARAHARRADARSSSDADPSLTHRSHASQRCRSYPPESASATWVRRSSPPTVAVEDLRRDASLVALSGSWCSRRRRSRAPMPLPPTCARTRSAAPARSRSTASSTRPRGRPRRSRPASRSGSRRTARRPSLETQLRGPLRRRRDLRRRVGRRSASREQIRAAAHAPRRRRRRRRGRGRRSTATTIAAPPTCSSSTPPACSATCCCSTTRSAGRHLGRGVDRRRRGRRRAAGPPSSASRSASSGSPAATPRSGASRSCAGRAHAGAERRGRRGRAAATEVVSKFGVVDGIDRLKPGRRLELLPYATRRLRARCRSRPAIRSTTRIDAPRQPRPRSQVRPRPRVHAVGDDQPRLRPGRGRSVAGQPVGERAVLRREAAVLPRGRRSVQAADRQRRQQRRGRVLQPPDRRGAAGEPDMDYDYIKAPTSTTIYGAAKLTGKTHGGWSVGVLDAVTGEESRDDRRRGAGMQMHAGRRAADELRGRRASSATSASGRTSIGASATAVNRALDDTAARGLAPRSGVHAAGCSCAPLGRQRVAARRARASAAACTAARRRSRSTQQAQPPPVPAPRRAARPPRSDAHEPVGASASTWKVGRFGDTKHWRFGVRRRSAHARPRAQRRGLPDVSRIA